MPARNSAIWTVVFFALLATATAAHARDWSVAFARGAVLQLDGERWREVERGTVIPPNRAVRTLKGAAVRLESDGDVVEVGAETAINLLGDASLIHHYAGTLVVHVGASAATLRIEAEGLVVVPRGGTVEIKVDAAGPRVSLARGEAEVSEIGNPEATVLKSGDAATIVDRRIVVAVAAAGGSPGGGGAEGGSGAGGGGPGGGGAGGGGPGGGAPGGGGAGGGGPGGGAPGGGGAGVSGGGAGGGGPGGGGPGGGGPGGGGPGGGGGGGGPGGGNPNAGGGNPNAGDGNPNAGGGNPNAGGGNPNAGGGNPNAGGGNPNAGGGNPNAGGGKAGKHD